MNTRQLVFKNALIGLMVLSLLLAGSLTVSAELEGFDVIAENEYLTLYLNPQTTELAVEDKAGDVKWFTNPQDRHRDRGRVLERLSSQVTITQDPNRVQKNNFRYSINYNQFEITPLDQGVRLDYAIVEEWRPEHYVPHMIEASRLYNLIIDNVERERDRKDVLDQYDLIKLAPLGDAPRVSLPGINKDRLFGDYTVKVLNPTFVELEERLVGIRMELAEVEQAIASNSTEELTAQKDRLERELRNSNSRYEREYTDILWRLVYKIQGHRLDLDRIDDIRYSDVVHLIDTPTFVLKDIPRFVMQDLQEIITSAGYTPIEAGEDHLKNNLDPQLPNLEIFKVPIEYRIDGPHFVVRVPSSEVEYPIDVEDRIGQKHTFPILSIGVLEYFGAANTDTDGYMLIPDGSGALIYHNNKRTYASAYNESVFGRDNTLDTQDERQIHPEIIRLPVFGMKNGDNAFLAIIEEGAALARIRADISEKTDNYNRVYAQFTTMPSGVIDLEGAGQVPAYQSRAYQGDFIVRYCFLSGDKANYVGMANYYQQYLVDRYQLERQPAKENIPFFLELIGAIDKRQPILGVSRDVIYPLTTFDQSKQIVNELIANGISNIKLKYNGWLDGGVRHNYPDAARLERVVGNQSQLMDLNRFMEQNGFELYPSIGLLNVYRNTAFNAFNPRQDGSRFLNRLVARSFEYEISSFVRMNRLYKYVISPSTVGPLVDSFLEAYQSYDIGFISLFDMAREVNSDFRYDLDRVVDRVESVGLIEDQMQKMRDQQLKIMVDHGNVYALPYADSILNIPVRSSMRNLFNEEIPFYQMVVRGFIDYAGTPINLAGSWQQALLKTLESGSYPYFIGSYAPSYEVMTTDFANLYALHYRDWLPFATDVYETVNSVLKDVIGQRIIYHQRLGENVYQTVYEKGLGIIVNYNKHSVEVNGLVVGGEDFIIVEEEGNEY